VTGPLTSPRNPRLKAVAALRKRRGRDAEGRILIDGPRALGLALDAGMAVETVLHCPERDGPEAAAVLVRAAQAGAAVEAVGVSAFGRVAYGDAPDSVVAVAPRPATGLDRISLGSAPLLLVAVGVEKPGNLGALLRAADGAGADGLIACDGAADPFGPNAVRASRGIVFSMPLAEVDTAEALDWLKARGVKIVAALPDGPLNYTDADLTGPVAIVLGEEHAGLPDPWRAAADLGLRVPMRGRADSLNLAVTGALLLYEAVRQRGGDR